MMSTDYKAYFGFCSPELSSKPSLAPSVNIRSVNPFSDVMKKFKMADQEGDSTSFLGSSPLSRWRLVVETSGRVRHFENSSPRRAWGRGWCRSSFVPTQLKLKSEHRYKHTSHYIFETRRRDQMPI